MKKKKKLNDVYEKINEKEGAGCFRHPLLVSLLVAHYFWKYFFPFMM